ncbi:MAG: hypothetical protein A2289_14775 [Deltaproteobacteria bacterium RIFOXYA12_FULL_58_15]|nr:MAG: hypothetical protein A2289_14775 [Deltaproteobacteria bacterium RIFOXYA12_FULL_58_15]
MSQNNMNNDCPICRAMRAAGLDTPDFADSHFEGMAVHEASLLGVSACGESLWEMAVDKMEMDRMEMEMEAPHAPLGRAERRLLASLRRQGAFKEGNRKKVG